MNYNKQIVQKTKPEHPLKFSQLIVRTLIFLSAFLVFWFLTNKMYGVSKDKLFISETDITITWVISLGIIIFLWFFYLIIFMRDNTLKRMWEVIKLRGSLGGTKETGIRWWTFFIISIITIYFSSPSLYSNINALNHKVVYEGETVLKENKQSKTGRDKRFKKVFIEEDGSKLEFEGNSNEITPLLNKKVTITVYQGIFTKYALIKGPN